MMEIVAVDNVPSLDRSMYTAKLTSLEDRLNSLHTKQSLRNDLKASTGIEASQIVGLDLFDKESEEEGEIMLLAMILLQLHGVKFPGSVVPNLDNGSPSDESKKKRQRTSPEQLAVLEQIFQTDKMPSQQTRIALADQLGMSSRRVQIWFQNKRAKVKRGVGKGDLNDSTEIDVDLSRRNSLPPLTSSSCLSAPSSPTTPSASSPPQHGASLLSMSSSAVLPCPAPLSSTPAPIPAAASPALPSLVPSPTAMPHQKKAIPSLPFSFQPPPHMQMSLSTEPSPKVQLVGH